MAKSRIVLCKFFLGVEVFTPAGWELLLPSGTRVLCVGEDGDLRFVLVEMDERKNCDVPVRFWVVNEGEVPRECQSADFLGMVGLYQKTSLCLAVFVDRKNL